MQRRRNRSIVDQDVERPECANRLLNPRSDARVVAHVDRGRTDVRELMSEVLRGILMSLDIADHDVRAFCRQEFCLGITNAVGRACAARRPALPYSWVYRQGGVLGTWGVIRYDFGGR